MRRFQLKKTCGDCHETWNYYYKDEYIGYLHLRHGYVSVFCASEGCDIYNSETRGNGIFADEEERTHHLNQGCIALDLAMDQQNHKTFEPLYEIIYD